MPWLRGPLNAIVRTLLPATAVAVAWSTSAALAGPTRVAFVTLHEGDTLASSIDLASVELASDSAVTVLDPSQLHRVLKENEVFLASTSLDDGARAVCRLLRASLLIACERTSHSDAGRCTAYDASTGCRLIDSDLTDGDAGHVGYQIARLARKAIAKHHGFKVDGLTLISFHGRRSVDLPSAKTAATRQLERRIEQRFASSASFAVLERARLRFFNDERRLPSVKQHAQLLAAATSIIVQFASAADGRIVVSLVVRDDQPAAEWTDRVVINPEDDRSINQEIELLASKAEAAFAARGANATTESEIATGDSDYRGELAKLRAEAKRHQKAEEWEDATTYYEASYALQPSRYRDLCELIRVLDDRAHDLLEPVHRVSTRRDYAPEAHEGVWRQALRLMRYRLDLIAELHHRQTSDPRWLSLARRGQRNAWWPPSNRASYGFRTLRPNRTPELYREVKAYSERYLRVMFDDIGSDLLELFDDPNAVSNVIQNAPRPSIEWDPLGVDWRRLCIDQFDRWHAKWLAVRTDDTRYDRTAESGLMRMANVIVGYGGEEIPPEEIEAMYERTAKLTSARSSYVRHRVQLRLLRLDREHRGLNDAGEIRERVEPMINELLALATQPLREEPASYHELTLYTGESFPGDSRRRGSMWMLREAVSLMPTEETVARARERVIDCLFEKGICDWDLCRATLTPLQTDYNVGEILTCQERIDDCGKLLHRLRQHEKHFDPSDFQRLVNYFTFQRTREQSWLAKQRGEPFGERPWVELKLLEGSPHWPSGRNPSTTLIPSFHVSGDTLSYATTVTRDDSDLVLTAKRATVGHGDATPTSLGRVVVPATLLRDPVGYYELPDRLSTVFRETTPERVVADDRWLFWGRSRQGIVVMPLDRGDGWTLDEETGLPSNYVRCLAVAEGKLYAWVGRPGREAIFVSYSPSSKEVEVLASSERIVDGGPLDGLPQDIARAQHYDAPRRRLIFFYDRALRSWDPATRNTEELLNLRHDPHVGRLRNGINLRSFAVDAVREAVLINVGKEYWALDLRTDSFIRLPEAGRPAVPPNSSPPTAWLGSRLWLRNPWALYDYQQNKLIPLALPIAAGTPPWWWQPGAEAVGGGRRSIFWDRHHLWVAQLSD